MKSNSIAALQRATAIFRSLAHLNWALADQMTVSGGNFLSGIVLVRVLGIHDYGQFVLVWMVVVFVQNIQHAAINSPMMSIASSQPSLARPAYCATLFVHQLVFGVFSVISVIAFTLLCNELFPTWTFADLLWPLTAIVLTSQTQDFLRRYFFTIEQPVTSFVIDVVRYAVQLALLISLFFFPSFRLNLSGVLWAMTLAASLSTFVAILNVRGLKWPAGTWREISSRYWHFSKWMVASTLLMWTASNLFYLITAALLGPASVGILKAAQNVMAVTHIFLQGLENVLPIRAAIVYAQGGLDRLMIFARTGGTIIASITACVAVIACSFSGYLMQLLYGSEFHQYGWVLVGYAVIYFFTSLNFTLDLVMRTLERTGAITLAYGRSIIISALIGFPLIKWLNLTGALVGLSIHAIIPGASLYLALRKIRANAHVPTHTTANSVDSKQRHG